MNPLNIIFSRRWTRIFLIVLPLLLIINYLVIFQWTFFEGVSRTIWPDASFHPAPFAPIDAPRPAGGGQEKDYWIWDTRTEFKYYPKQQHNNKPGAWKWNTTAEDQGEDDDDCLSFPTHLLNNIQVTLKVGAADSKERTNAQLSSVIKCIPNILIASDLDSAYGPYGHNATDVLASLPPETYLLPEDYKVYSEQKNNTELNRTLAPSHEGWKLDKYKFLSEVEAAVARNPKADWFVFFESDTYIFWDNMFRLLSAYDSSLPYYFGSPSPGRLKPITPDNPAPKDDRESKIWFAYGGAGFVLSGTAAHRLVDRGTNALHISGPRVTGEYKEDVRRDCCGDSMLGWALYDKAGVEISGLWPMFNPHVLHGIPFGPGTKQMWCEPVVSLHKSWTADYRKLWEWENGRDRARAPVLYRDLATSFQQLGEVERREDWDNADWDGFDEASPDHTSNQSFQDCKRYCHEHEECWQFTWHGHHCYMSRAIRLGRHKGPDGEHEKEDRRYIAGWDVDKIRKWAERNKCEEGAHWVKPSIYRVF